MRAGLIRQRITIESATEAANATGELIPTWSALATRWASVEPLQGRERFAAQQVQPETDHRIRLRYDTALTGLKPKMRVKFETRVFDVLAVLNLEERNREFELLCREVTT